MPSSAEEDLTIYNVVMNHEEQYSIWPAERGIPNGWHPVGKSGSKDECLSYIDHAWTDMRPLSLRRKMEQDAAVRSSADPADPAPQS